MGLDMYAFAVERGDVLEDSPVDFGLKDNADREEVQYWRKHPDLHGWMERLYREKGGTDPDFNCVNVQITHEDLNRLEGAVKNCALPHTEGFFFGASYPEDAELDTAFIRKARLALDAGKVVYYTSWW
jgi:hypothetical protein